VIEQTYWAQFYWFERQESLDDCMHRLTSVLSDLKALHEAFATWEVIRKSGGRRKIPQRPHAVLREALLEGRNWTDVGHELIEDLGYTLTLTNTLSGPSRTTIGARMGVYTEWVANTFLLGPLRSSSLADYCSLTFMVQLAQIIIDRMMPDYGEITSDEYRRTVVDFTDPNFVVEPRKPDVGWITYISRGYWDSPELPSPYERHAIPKRGDLIVVPVEGFDAANHEHVRLANRLRDLVLGS